MACSRRQQRNMALRTIGAYPVGSIPRQRALPRHPPHRCFYRIRSRRGRFVLPKAHDKPPSSNEKPIGLGVTLTVSTQFLAPVLSVLFRRARSVLRTRVPETSVDEHSNALPGEDDVRGTANCSDRPIGYAIAKAISVQQPSNGEFGTSVSRSVALHDPSTRR
jgi:hypothetical protein